MMLSGRPIRTDDSMGHVAQVAPKGTRGQIAATTLSDAATKDKVRITINANRSSVVTVTARPSMGGA